MIWDVICDFLFGSYDCIKAIGATAIASIIGGVLSLIGSGVSAGVASNNSSSKTRKRDNAMLRNWLLGLDPSMVSDDPYMSALMDYAMDSNTNYGFSFADLLFASLNQQSQLDMMDAQLENQKELMSYEQELNSPANIASMMREAGLNPDLLGISGQAGLASGGSAAMAGNGTSFQLPNSNQLRQTDVNEQATIMNLIDSCFSFASDLANVFLRGKEHESQNKVNESQVDYNEQVIQNRRAELERMGLLNEDLRIAIEHHNFDMIGGMTDYITDNYQKLGGKDFKDFDLLEIGDVYSPLFKQIWSNYGSSTPAKIEQIVNDTVLKKASFDLQYQDEKSRLLWEAFEADMEYRKQANQFLGVFFSELEPSIFSSLKNLEASNMMTYQETYDPEKDALSFNASSESSILEQANYLKYLQKFNPELAAQVENARNSFEQTMIKYDSVIWGINNKLKTKALSAYSRTQDDKYLSEYWRLETGQFGATKIDRIIGRFKDIAGGILSPIAEGVTAGLIGARAGRSGSFGTRRNYTNLYGPDGKPMSVDYSNIILN